MSKLLQGGVVYVMCLDKNCQKIILVVSPLTALMESQAASLNEKSVPAVPLTSNSRNPDRLLQVSFTLKWQAKSIYIYLVGNR
jgi:superfamily II DNA helicase RecQ